MGLSKQLGKDGASEAGVMQSVGMKKPCHHTQAHVKGWLGWPGEPGSWLPRAKLFRPDPGHQHFRGYQVTYDRSLRKNKAAGPANTLGANKGYPFKHAHPPFVSGFTSPLIHKHNGQNCRTFSSSPLSSTPDPIDKGSSHYLPHQVVLPYLQLQPIIFYAESFQQGQGHSADDIYAGI
eukprot:1160631-Pelagomonas_calceolata.AAC.3